MVTYKDLELNNLKDIVDNGFVLIDEYEPVITHKIEEVVKSRGLTTADVVKLVGLSRQTMNTIKKNKSKPSIDFALKLAYVLDVPVEKIFELNEEAWIDPLKTTNDSGYYYDNLNDEVILSSEKNERVKKDGFEFFEPKNPKVKYKKTEGIRIINRLDYDGRLKQIYQRIGVQIEPYKIKG